MINNLSRGSIYNDKFEAFSVKLLVYSILCQFETNKTPEVIMHGLSLVSTRKILSGYEIPMLGYGVGDYIHINVRENKS